MDRMKAPNRNQGLGYETVVRKKALNVCLTRVYKSFQLQVVISCEFLEGFRGWAEVRHGWKETKLLSYASVKPFYPEHLKPSNLNLHPTALSLKP